MYCTSVRGFAGYVSLLWSHLFGSCLPTTGEEYMRLYLIFVSYEVTFLCDVYVLGEPVQLMTAW